MRHLLLILLFLTVGCKTQNQPSIGMDTVRVPKEYQTSLGWIDKAPSQYERYLGMFREGYWDCIMKYLEDMNYVPTKADRDANGWISEIEGYQDGYRAAERDMERNIQRFGKDRTLRYLKTVCGG
jgi:hypothetical protein